MNTQQVEVTLAGETRTVQVSQAPNGRWFGPKDAFVARIGAGKANYPADLVDFKANKRTGALELVRSTLVRNRAAQVVGWADAAGVTNARNNARV